LRLKNHAQQATHKNMHEILPLKEIAAKQIGAKQFVQLENPPPPAPPIPRL